MIFSYILSFFTLTNVILVGFIYFICVYILKVNKPATTTFYHADTDKNWFLRKTLESSPTYEPPFLKNSFFQTFLVFNATKCDVQFDREYVDLPDGGQVGLDWVKSGTDLPDSAPVLMIFPGITGEPNTMSVILLEASRRNYRAVVFNKRGHNNTILKTPKLQGLSDPGDLRQCMEMISNRYPSAKMAAVGHSGGCALLTRYLSEYSENSLISACVQISAGYNLINFCLTLSWVYDRLMAGRLKKAVIEPNRGMLSSVIDMEALDKCTSLMEFDSLVYCKMLGFRDFAEYYTENNPVKNIEKVDVPVLCINSDDDPVCKPCHIPFDLFKKPNWMLLNTNMGGHFFVDKKNEMWADLRALDYIEAVWKYEEKNN